MLLFEDKLDVPMDKLGMSLVFWLFLQNYYCPCSCWSWALFPVLGRCSLGAAAVGEPCLSCTGAPLQVLPLLAAERWHRVGSAALLVRHAGPAGLLHCAVGARRLRPGWVRQRLHQRVPLRAKPHQGAGGQSDRAAQEPQVSTGCQCQHSSGLLQVAWCIRRC